MGLPVAFGTAATLASTRRAGDFTYDGSVATFLNLGGSPSNPQIKYVGLNKLGTGKLVLNNTTANRDYFGGNIVISNGTLTCAEGSATNGAIIDTSGAGTLAWAAGLGTATAGGITGTGTLPLQDVTATPCR